MLSKSTLQLQLKMFMEIIMMPSRMMVIYKISSEKLETRAKETTKYSETWKIK